MSPSASIPQRYYLFAYGFHEAQGGFNDLIGDFSSFDEAEAHLHTLTDRYQYEGAHIGTIDEQGKPIIVADYFHTDQELDANGYWVFPVTSEIYRWLRMNDQSAG